MHGHHVQMASEHLQGWGLHHLSMQPLPAHVAQSEAAQCHAAGVKVCATMPVSRAGRRGERGIGCDMTLL